MCRWLAYSGSPILLEELLYKPDHSLIDQSLHARLGVETTNGDGFGVGWYGADTDAPAVFRSIEPAWNDRNLREVAGHVASPLFLAHIRASRGRPSSRPTATRFATAGGCGYTMASCATSRASSASLRSP
jgi:predicted glutamine amidotransferase